MRMVMKNGGTPSQSFPWMGFIEVHTKYEFRGRRLDSEVPRSIPSIVDQPQASFNLDSSSENTAIQAKLMACMKQLSNG
jgi:hypothetical protein